jgi:hypothetical protein
VNFVEIYKDQDFIILSNINMHVMKDVYILKISDYFRTKTRMKLLFIYKNNKNKIIIFKYCYIFINFNEK